MPVSEQDMDDAVHRLATTRKEAADKRAARLYMEELTKHLEAKWSLESKSGSAEGRKAEARARPEYLAHLQALRTAIEQDDEMKHERDDLGKIIDIWRSLKATERTLRNAY